MAIDGILLKWSGVASSDFSSSQYCAAVLDATGQWALAGAGVNADGIMQDAPVIGRVGGVAVYGVSKAVAGAAVAAGAEVMANASGQLIAATAGNFGIGKAVTAASGVGILFSVLLRPGGKQ